MHAVLQRPYSVHTATQSQEEKARADEKQPEQAQDRECIRSDTREMREACSASIQRQSLRKKKREQKRNSESKHRTETRSRMLSVHSATESKEGKAQAEEE
jgi:hypothetical protein